MSLEGVANPINRSRRHSLCPYVLLTVLLMIRTASTLGRVCFNSKMEHTLAGSVLCEADMRGRKRETPRGYFLMWPWSPGALPVPSVNRSSGNYSAACLLAPDSKSSPPCRRPQHWLPQQLSASPVRRHKNKIRSAMGYTGVRSPNFGNRNGSQILKILKVYAELYVNTLIYVVFLEKESTAFTRFSKGSVTQKR